MLHTVIHSVMVFIETDIVLMSLNPIRLSTFSMSFGGLCNLYVILEPLCTEGNCSGTQIGQSGSILQFLRQDMCFFFFMLHFSI